MTAGTHASACGGSRSALKTASARQFSRFLRHPRGLFLQSLNLLLQLLPLHGCDPVDETCSSCSKREAQRWRATAGSACPWIAKDQPKPSPSGVPWHPAFSPHCHEACIEAAPPLLENHQRGNHLNFSFSASPYFSFYPPGLRQPLQPRPQLRILPRLLIVSDECLLVGTDAFDAAPGRYNVNPISLTPFTENFHLRAGREGGGMCSPKVA